MSDYSQGPGWWQASDGKWYPPQGQAGAAPQAPPPYGQPYGGAPVESSKATAALVLGIISIVFNACFVPGILAILWGSKEKDYDSKAKAGYILGIIGTALSLLGSILYFTVIANS